MYMDLFKIENLLNEELVFMNVEADNSEDLLRFLAAEAHKKGYVKSGYADAVIEREHLYPTALPTEIMKIAVPHSIKRDQVITPVIIIATLKNPIAFKEMGDGERDVMVDIVFMLAVCGSNEHLTFLQKIVSMFSDTEAMSDIKQTTTSKALIEVLKKHLSE